MPLWVNFCLILLYLSDVFAYENVKMLTAQNWPCEYKQWAEVLLWSFAESKRSET
jgi:hypothetical protein